MLTVNSEDSNIQRAVQLGAAGYLLKTASIEDIVHALQSTMQGGMPIDPFIARKYFHFFLWMSPILRNILSQIKKKRLFA